MTAINDRSSPIALLLSRHSGTARDMIAPGPDEAQLQRILAAAVSVPDHGRLMPWRFVIVPTDQRDGLADAFERIFMAEKEVARDAEREAVRNFARFAPTLVVVLHRPNPQSRIPLPAQSASAAAAAMTLSHAAHAEGFVCCWLTGWAAYSPQVTALFGEPDDNIVGFMFIGTPGRPLSRRDRPELAEVVSVWRATPEGG